MACSTPHLIFLFNLFLSSLTLHHVVPNQNSFLSSVGHKRRYFEEYVNSFCPYSESQLDSKQQNIAAQWVSLYMKNKQINKNFLCSTKECLTSLKFQKKRSKWFLVNYPFMTCTVYSYKRCGHTSKFGFQQLIDELCVCVPSTELPL